MSRDIHCFSFQQGDFQVPALLVEGGKLIGSLGKVMDQKSMWMNYLLKIPNAFFS